MDGASRLLRLNLFSNDTLTSYPPHTHPKGKKKEKSTLTRTQ